MTLDFEYFTRNSLTWKESLTMIPSRRYAQADGTEGGKVRVGENRLGAQLRQPLPSQCSYTQPYYRQRNCQVIVCKLRPPKR